MLVGEELQREFDYSDADFQFVKKKIYQLAGISLSDAKRQMVYSRLARRLRFLGLQRFKDYCLLIKNDDSGEVPFFINALTTNKTSFFREKHHFDYLANSILPELAVKNVRTKRVRIWSAACSSGEEPYTIAMVLDRSKITNRGWDSKILATDLDSKVVDTAQQGVYNKRLLDDVDPNYRRSFFLKNEKSQSAKIKVAQKLVELITFKQLNLIERWPIKGPFDVIFCRNVLIYFDRATQQMLFKRFYDLLADNGYLIIGHSENLGEMNRRFEVLGRTIYRKL